MAPQAFERRCLENQVKGLAALETLVEGIRLKAVFCKQLFLPAYPDEGVGKVVLVQIVPGNRSEGGNRCLDVVQMMLSAFCPREREKVQEQLVGVFVIRIRNVLVSAVELAAANHYKQVAEVPAFRHAFCAQFLDGGKRNAERSLVIAPAEQQVRQTVGRTAVILNVFFIFGLERDCLVPVLLAQVVLPLAVIAVAAPVIRLDSGENAYGLEGVCKGDYLAEVVRQVGGLHLCVCPGAV